MLALLPLALGLVIADAHIVTLDDKQPLAHHAAIVDGKFAYVGDDLAAARRAAGKGARELDVLGTTVVPGFNDAHVHFGLSITLGAEDALDLGPGAPDRATFVRDIEDAAATPVLPDHHDWIFVTTRTLPEGVRTGHDLPVIARPLFVVTEHGALLNALALARLHLSASDAPDGLVRGRLIPAALDRAVKSLPNPVLHAAAKRFLRTCAQLGLTSVQLMDELPELFEGLLRAHELTVRVRMMVFGYRFETELYIPHFVSSDDDWVKVDALKYFDDDWARLPRAELRRIYAEVQGTGRPVVIHVLSRGALRSLLDQLDALERILPGGAEHFRFDHADEVPPELAARIAKLKIVVCPNPSLLPEWQSERAFPMRTLLDAGVTTCIGTDFVGKHVPARPLSPLRGIMLAVTHGGYGTQQRITPEEALRAYTIGSARAEGRRDLGVIRVGALGDLTGLSADPTRVATEDIDKITVRYTIVGGRVVYENRPPPLMRAR
ncbi:MAG: amidohydrolase family protein [Polyangia bacterium]